MLIMIIAGTTIRRRMASSTRWLLWTDGNVVSPSPLRTTSHAPDPWAHQLPRLALLLPEARFLETRPLLMTVAHLPPSVRTLLFMFVLLKLYHFGIFHLSRGKPNYKVYHCSVQDAMGLESFTLDGQYRTPARPDFLNLKEWQSMVPGFNADRFIQDLSFSGMDPHKVAAELIFCLYRQGTIHMTKKIRTLLFRFKEITTSL